VSTIIDYIKIHGGVTIKNKQIWTYDNGYQVGYILNSISVSPLNLKETLLYYMDAYEEFGVRFNEKTNKYDFDVCINISDLTLAMHIANTENQESIWDWQADDVIFL